MYNFRRRDRGACLNVVGVMANPASGLSLRTRFNSIPHGICGMQLLGHAKTAIGDGPEAVRAPECTFDAGGHKGVVGPKGPRDFRVLDLEVVVLVELGHEVLLALIFTLGARTSARAYFVVVNVTVELVCTNAAAAVVVKGIERFVEAVDVARRELVKRITC